MPIVYPLGSARVAVAAGAKIATYSDGAYQVSKEAGYPNVPATESLLKLSTGGFYTSGVLNASAVTYVIIEPSEAPVFYETGTDAVVKVAIRNAAYQSTPGELNATGAVTAAMIFSGIVTSTTAAAVAGTVPTGTVLDAASTWSVDDAFDWSVITTGANAFTVTADTGHTLVGNMVVAAGKAGRFRTRKTAANTFVTYSLSNT